MTAAQYGPIPTTTIPEGVGPTMQAPPLQHGARGTGSGVSNLPITGADPWELVAFGLVLVLVAVGLLALAAAKRRRRRPPIITSPPVAT